VILQMCSNPEPRFLQQHLDIGHGLFGLAGGIADRHALARVEILANLAADEHHRAARDDRLAQIVVELLLRISVPRIELAKARMNHGAMLSGNGVERI